MITQLFNLHCVKILTLFSISPGSKFKRKEIQEKTKINNVPLDNSLAVLLSSKLVERERNFYFLNFENDQTKSLVRLVSGQFKKLKELPLNVYYPVIELTNFFSEKKGLELFLFGSYAKLAYSEGSDVDFALVSDGQINKKEVNKMIKKLEKVYQKQIDVHYFGRKSFYENKSDPLVRSIIRDSAKLI